ncbi:tail fiber domain-containing protein [Brumimicrobium aurantiacum]|uniref:T9SS C-terminal target domain-containing protein n=1 Tax=Brumimicrobium aurantiacum TaxID=1737063 RepID=A0A3E1EZS7_9FLAO|nr:tail fiber domain-containing protein [Brumimicrobium aurantiacum]RFC55055.1 T9SS C-terminal target domain-containing protein [Brumimicrobium aurantiacum]
MLGAPIDYQRGNLIRTDGANNIVNRWQLFTGATSGTSTEKFQIFTTLNSPIANGQEVSNQNITLQASQRDMIFNAGGNNERMRILGQDHNLSMTGPWFATARAGNVGIGTAHPLTMLHIGDDGASGAGWRQWMDIGTFYGSDGGFDNMYIGLREIANDRNEAIINFGNNPSSNPANGDNLRFVFTAAPNNGIASTQNGFEIARMWADGQDNGRMGIGDFNSAGTIPSNTLEIMSSSGSPYWGAPGGSSGLRFTNLTSSQQPILNPGNGVLSVDNNGDVIYVDGGTAGGNLGNNCGTTQNPLANNYEIPLESHNFYFSDPSTSLDQDENRVVIGRDCNAQAPAKLNVYRELGINNPLLVMGLQVVNTDIGFSQPYLGIGVGVHSESLKDNRENIGVWGIGENASNNFGGRFHSSTLFDGVNVGLTNYGIDVSAGYGDVNYGVDALAVGGSQNYGIRAIASNSTGVNYGVYGSANSFGGSATSYAGFFDGDVVRTGSDNFSSDSILKDNIHNITNATQVINQLNPVNFEFKHTAFPQMNLADGTQYGFIAQDVEQILPDIVSESIFPASYDSLGNVINQQVNFKSLNYQSFIPILTKGFQEQQTEIDSLNEVINSKDSLLYDLNNRLTHLESCLSNILPILCQLNQQAINTNSEEDQNELESQLSVILNNRETIILDQNVPNPFAEKTVIDFSIPESVQKAQLHFYNNMGKLIKSVEIIDRGKGSLTVYGADLSSGLYTYTLIADGKAVNTKKMIKR